MEILYGDIYFYISPNLWQGVPDGVGSHVRARGSGLRACEAYGRPVVEEVRGAAEGEGIVCGLFKAKNPRNCEIKQNLPPQFFYCGWSLVLAFLINPIGASEVDTRRIEFKPGDQPTQNTLLREGPPP